MNDKVEMIAAIPSENHGQCTFCYTVTVQSSEEELENSKAQRKLTLLVCRVWKPKRTLERIANAALRTQTRSKSL